MPSLSWWRSGPRKGEAAVRFLLDTSAMIAHHRQEAGWERVQALFEDVDAEIIAASVTFTEFARRLRELGASPSEAHKIVESYQDLLDDVVVVDEKVAFSAFHLGCETPKRLPLVDALIAGAAAERGACLVHRDQHMAGIPPELMETLDLATL